jgi:hypothetical protein
MELNSDYSPDVLNIEIVGRNIFSIKICAINLQLVLIILFAAGGPKRFVCCGVSSKFVSGIAVFLSDSAMCHLNAIWDKILPRSIIV